LKRAAHRHRVAALLALALFASPLAAHEDPAQAKNRVSFQVERSRDVANDWVVATVGVTEEDSDAARLAGRVNEAMRWALDVAKRVEEVEARSGGYQTHPVHDSGKIVRWRASQDLLLESGDVDALSALLGELQSRLLLRGVSFGVSPETRRETEKALVTEALGAFQQRAKQVQGDLGARDHAIVSVSIHTPRGGGRPMAMEMRSVAKAGVAPPAFESGESTLSVNVDATIELEF
jgi:predicted secreted protein